MNILVACEKYGLVREAFSTLGHNAVSCDLEDTLLPGNHIKGDVRELLNNKNYSWDMMIAFPPCTHLAISGVRWFDRKQKEQEEALQFVQDLMNAPIEKICIENPKGIIPKRIKKWDQAIQPWMFGDPYTKSTYLWLKNLPKLVPTEIVSKGEFVIHGGKKIPRWYSNREFDRNKTFLGIAKAMAAQWG